MPIAQQLARDLSRPSVESLLRRAKATADPKDLLALAREARRAGTAAVETTDSVQLSHVEGGSLKGTLDKSYWKPHLPGESHAAYMARLEESARWVPAKPGERPRALVERVRATGTGGDSYARYYDAAGRLYRKAMKHAGSQEQTVAIATEAVKASRHRSLYAYNGYVWETRGNRILDAGMSGFNLAIRRSRTRQEAEAASESLRGLAQHDWDLGNAWQAVSRKAHGKGKALPSEPLPIGRRLREFARSLKSAVLG